MYYPHNIHFLWSAASMQGRSRDAIARARELGGAMQPEMMRAMPMLEYSRADGRLRAATLRALGGRS
jgi:hypothetical protein